MGITLAITYHDPAGRLAPLAERIVPSLAHIFEKIVVQASPRAAERTLAVFAAHGAEIVREPLPTGDSGTGLGHARREAVRRACALGAPHVMLCDGDRALFWADRHPDELADVVSQLPDADCTVLGRSVAAFASHPAVQRDTEGLVNRVFGGITGLPWDVTAAARGLSHRAVDALVAGCRDNAISVDVSWPLHLWRAGDFTLAYRSVDGLAFETPDRFAPEIAAAGGHAPWLAQLDADPRHWTRRLKLARVMMTAMETYAPRAAVS